MTDENVLTPGQQIKASLELSEAKSLVESRYGFIVRNIVELDAYDDCNYRVLCEDQLNSTGNPHVASIAKDGYVLKIINVLDSKKTGFIEAQNELLIFLTKKGFVCPVPVRQVDGSYYSWETIGKHGQRHVLRMLVYRPGEILENVTVTAELMKNIGSFVARLDKALEEFSHPAYTTQTSLWVLPAVPKLRDFLFAVDDKKDVVLIESIIATFEQKVLSNLSSLEKGIIHGDLNENNIIVRPDGRDVEAIIDFGDSHISCYVFELAVCLCYMITYTKSIAMAKHVIDGYVTARQLTQQEAQILKLCVCARFCQSLVLGLYSYQQEPNNRYLIRAHPIKWTLLKELWSMSDDKVLHLWGFKN